MYIQHQLMILRTILVASRTTFVVVIVAVVVSYIVLLCYMFLGSTTS